LRIRKGVRRHGVRLAVASSRPSALDANAKQALRFAPGAAEALLCALYAALSAGEGLDELAAAAGTNAGEVRALASLLSRSGKHVASVWRARLRHGPRGAHAVRALRSVAARL